MANVLITGGSGLIGKQLSFLLLSKGYSVAHLTRSSTNKTPSIKSFIWNPEKSEIDNEAVPWANHIVHLAGENVGQPWTNKAKQRILQSRIVSTKLIAEQLKKTNNRLESFISASAIGYYGADTGDKLLIEESPHGDGFLANVTATWEEATDACTSYTDRLVKIRTGIVLSKEGGALSKMAGPIRWGVGSALGSGKQWLSWIHINDLCKMYLFAIEKPLKGVLNGVGPTPTTNSDFMKELAHQLKRPLILPKVPAMVLKLLLGEMSILVLGSNKVEPVAFLKEGFTFEFANLREALKSLG
jgi:uncharacterized protein (TIGR01777 family)